VEVLLNILLIAIVTFFVFLLFNTFLYCHAETLQAAKVKYLPCHKYFKDYKINTNLPLASQMVPHAPFLCVDVCVCVCVCCCAFAKRGSNYFTATLVTTTSSSSSCNILLHTHMPHHSERAREDIWLVDKLQFFCFLWLTIEN